mmetsp:Transcript_47816/g.144614  ORF Transcript_47816/g.144614 Transcript_47816/m.144614 type:complete len:94 (-) Transcript_47816:227-508(-)
MHNQILHCWESKVDGSAWGVTFPHLFLMAHGQDVFPVPTQPKLSARAIRVSAPNSEESVGSIAFGGSRPVPRVFGFGVHPSAAEVRYPLLKVS